MGLRSILFIELPPRVEHFGEWHHGGGGLDRPYRTGCRGIMLCVALSTSIVCTYVGVWNCGVKLELFPGVCDGFEPSWSAATDPLW
jgi:hypothetical protein